MTDENYTFEQTKARLDEILVEVREKDTSLEKSIELLEEGVRLANRCNELIDRTSWERPAEGEGSESEDSEATPRPPAEASADAESSPSESSDSADPTDAAADDVVAVVEVEQTVDVIETDHGEVAVVDTVEVLETSDGGVAVVETVEVIDAGEFETEEGWDEGGAGADDAAGGAPADDERA